MGKLIKSNQDVLLEKLVDEVMDLNKTIKESNLRSEKLENSNYKLQLIMVVLTGLATIAAVYPIFSGLIVNIINPLLKTLTDVSLSQSWIIFVTSLISVLSGVFSFLSSKRFVDSVNIKDSFEAILFDKDGKIKDIRTSKNEK